MAAQKCKKTFLAEMFHSVYYPKTHQLSDSLRTNGRLAQNPKTRGFRELFLPESDFKTCSTVVNFSKNHPDFGSLETNQRNKIQT